MRDLILGRPIADLDYTTSARPALTEKILASWGSTIWSIGRQWGTIGARRDGVTVEVTTYRSDRYQADSRKPLVQFGTTLEGDLARRDFTVNAMAVQFPDLRFVDPFGGLADLEAGILATPGPATQSFDDDPLRMLRAARFAAQLGFTVSEEALAAMAAMAERITICSAERIQGELTKLLLAPDPRRGLEVLVYTGLADLILPEVSSLQREVDEHGRHKDIYEHSLTVLEQAIAQESGPDGPVPGPDLVLRWASLLHDIGKPSTRRFEAGGKVSFHHHEVVGAGMAKRRLRSLRYEKAMVDDVARLVELHLRFHGYGEAGWTDSAVRRYVTDAGGLLERLHILSRADCTTRNRRKAAELSFAYDDLEARIAELAQAEELASIRPDLDGHAIMEILGIPPGKDVGRAYQHLLDLRMEHGPLGSEGARAALEEWWAGQS